MCNTAVTFGTIRMSFLLLILLVVLSKTTSATTTDRNATSEASREVQSVKKGKSYYNKVVKYLEFMKVFEEKVQSSTKIIDELETLSTAQEEAFTTLDVFGMSLSRNSNASLVTAVSTVLTQHKFSLEFLSSKGREDLKKFVNKLVGYQAYGESVLEKVEKALLEDK